jgi:2,3-diketo-5-methylthio-1-phosphopentane phosphatase
MHNLSLSPAIREAISADRDVNWAIACDFDGTIAKVDVTNELLIRFAKPEWEDVEADWVAGKIGSRECMALQVALLRVSRAELDAFLDTVEIDAAFPAFVADCRARNVPIRVVSDGLDYSVRRVLVRHGLGDLPVATNRLVQTAPTEWKLEFPYFRENCSALSGTCKCAVAAENGTRRTLLIGDGTSDFCLAGDADYVFAKHKLLAHCLQKGIPHRAFAGFDVARSLLAQLLGHHTQHAANNIQILERSIDG